MGAGAANGFARNIRIRDLTAGRCVCVQCRLCSLSIMRRYPGLVQYPPVCVVSRVLRYRSPILLIPLWRREGTKLIPTHPPAGRSCWSYAFIGRCETCNVLLPIKRVLSNTGFTFMGEEKVAWPSRFKWTSILTKSPPLAITSFDDLLGKSVNSTLNGEIFFLNGQSLFMPLLLILFTTYIFQSYNSNCQLCQLGRIFIRPGTRMNRSRRWGGNSILSLSRQINDVEECNLNSGDWLQKGM